MNNYYYSQKYSVYANKLIVPGLTMAKGGCVITNLAMILSYFNDRAFYPDQMLDWMKKNNGILPDGRVKYDVFCKASDNWLRFSYIPNPKAGETTYGIRQVFIGSAPAWHWIIDHPLIPNKIIDPYNGLVKAFNSFSYTGQARYFIGKK